MSVSALPLDALLSPWALGLLGLMVGSFLNVVVHRLPIMMERQWWADVAGQLADGVSFRRVFQAVAPAGLEQAAASLDNALTALRPLGLAQPASRCPACGHNIRWFENIPVLSWVALRGRCSACGTGIAKRYPLIELFTGATFVIVAWRFGATPLALAWCLFSAVLIALALIDWDTTVLPDALTLPLLWAGLVAAAAGWLPGLNAAASLGGAAVGYLSLWSVYWLFKIITGKEGMGYGDFKLLAALGAWLGWQAVLPIVLVASMSGAVVGVAMKVKGSLREGRFVPFGPFLVLGGLAVMLIGLPRVLELMGWA